MDETNPTPEPPVERRPWLRRLRIATSVFFTVLAVAICVLWVRSYSWADEMSCSCSRFFELGGASVAGRIGGGLQWDDSIQQFKSWRVAHTAIQDWKAAREDAERDLSGFGGFGVVSRGGGCVIVVPHWFALLLTLAFAVAPWRTRTYRFSLRTMLIATTVVATVLGLTVWLTYR
jgi:hypothetical protein